MSSGLYSGVSGLALGTGLYRDVSGLWSGATGLVSSFGSSNPYPGASLFLNFLTMTAPTFDSRITFSRGSNATLTDSTGKITYAPANLLLNTATLSTQSVTTQAISYILSFKGTGSVALSGAYTGSLAGTGATDRVYLKFTSTAASLTLTVTGTVTEAQLEPVTYQTTPSTYQATTSSAYYGPRFDYDPVTLAAKGLLIEEQRTNAYSYSSDYTQAYWAKTGIDIGTSSVQLAPDGVSYMQKIQELNTTSVHRLNPATPPSVTSGTQYTMSVFAKKGERDILDVFESSYTGVVVARFNLTNGTAQSLNAIATAKIEPWPDGVYRCIVTATAQSTGTPGFMNFLQLYDGASSYTGTPGYGLYVWGRQFEAGAFATSYIPTVASTVTRSADVATMTGANFSAWYNQAAGTFVVGADSFVNVSTTVYYPVGASDGANSNYIAAYEYNGKWGAASKVANVFQFDLNQASSYTANTPAKIALAYKADDFAVSVNGNTALTDSSGSVPTVDRLGIGSQNNVYYLNGHIRSLSYYNVRLPNTQLQSLTT